MGNACIIVLLLTRQSHQLSCLACCSVLNLASTLSPPCCSQLTLTGEREYNSVQGSSKINRTTFKPSGVASFFVYLQGFGAACCDSLFLSFSVLNVLHSKEENIKLETGRRLSTKPVSCRQKTLEARHGFECPSNGFPAGTLGGPAPQQCLAGGVLHSPRPHTSLVSPRWADFSVSGELRIWQKATLSRVRTGQK